MDDEAAQRGPLPMMQRLGGRWRPWWRLVLRARLRQVARARGCYRSRAGFVDHGTLIDGIARAVCLTPDGAERVMMLDQILLHPNRKLHLIGMTPDGRRRFRLDRIGDLRLADGTCIDPHALHDELMALYGPPGIRVHPPQAGANPPPRPGPPDPVVCRCLGPRRRGAGGPDRGGPGTARTAPDPLALHAAGGALSPRLDRGRQDHYPPHYNYDLEAFWRVRLVAAMQMLAMGQPVQSNVYGTMQALLSDGPAARSGLTRLILAEVDARPDDPCADQATDESIRTLLRAAATLIGRLMAHPGFRASRPLNFAAACLRAAHRLDEPDPDADLPAASAPGLRAFRRANALSGSDWHHGTFRMNRRAIQRIERLLRLWAPEHPQPQGAPAHDPQPSELAGR